MAHELDVWLFSDRIGRLSLSNGRLSFCYSPEWLTREDARPLSISLPLEQERISYARVMDAVTQILRTWNQRRSSAPWNKEYC